VGEGRECGKHAILWEQAEGAQCGKPWLLTAADDRDPDVVGIAQAVPIERTKRLPHLH